MKDSPSTLDSLLKLLPMLAMSYTGKTGQLQEAIPKITKRLAEMDQETKDDLAKQLLSYFPELEELVKNQ